MKFQNMLTLEDVEAQDWQLALKPGDCYVNESPVAGIIHNDGRREQLRNMPKIYCLVLSEAREVGPGFLWVRAFSAFEPGGERGLNCIVDATRPITREEFQQATHALARSASVKELQNGRA